MCNTNTRKSDCMVNKIVTFFLIGLNVQFLCVSNIVIFAPDEIKEYHIAVAANGLFNRIGT